MSRCRIPAITFIRQMNISKLRHFHRVQISQHETHTMQHFPSKPGAIKTQKKNIERNKSTMAVNVTFRGSRTYIRETVLILSRLQLTEPKRGPNCSTHSELATQLVSPAINYIGMNNKSFVRHVGGTKKKIPISDRTYQDLGSHEVADPHFPF